MKLCKNRNFTDKTRFTILVKNSPEMKMYKLGSRKWEKSQVHSEINFGK